MDKTMICCRIQTLKTLV